MTVLLDAGANIEEKDTENWTPLLYAAENGLPGVARVLIDRGADLEVVSDEGYTPLTRACWLEDGTEIIKMLVEKGARLERAVPKEGFCEYSSLYLDW